VRLAVAATVVVAVAACASNHRMPVPIVDALNRVPGELVDVEAGTVDGMITIVDFRADWCKSCDRLENMVVTDIESDHDIILRTVDVGDGDTPVARAYDIHGLPHVNIYDRDRRLRQVLVGDDTIRTVEVARSLRSD